MWGARGRLNPQFALFLLTTNSNKTQTLKCLVGVEFKVIIVCLKDDDLFAEKVLITRNLNKIEKLIYEKKVQYYCMKIL
jgi:hypothetical protein